MKNLHDVLKRMEDYSRCLIYLHYIRLVYAMIGNFWYTHICQETTIDEEGVCYILNFQMTHTLNTME